MSLLRWKELEKSKSELGNKINYFHNAITQHKMGQETSQGSFEKAFKPVTSKLDDVIKSNLKSGMPQRRKRLQKKVEVPNYGIDIEDEVEDMNLDDLFDDQPVLPQSEKQLVPKPPTYKESLEDMLKGKEIYVDPQYFPQDPQELPPEYDEDEGVDYALADEDETKEILDNLDITNYESIDKVLNQPEMTSNKKRMYISKIIKDTEYRRNRLKGYKSHVTKKYKSGNISEAERQIENKTIDNSRIVLNKYIKKFNDELKTIKGSGIKGRRKQRGGNVMFFNDAKQLLKKLDRGYYTVARRYKFYVRVARTISHE